MTSTSGGVVAVGVLSGLRYSRWALIPGLSVPVAWILAPLLVAEAIAVRDYLQELLLHWREALEAAKIDPASASEVMEMRESSSVTGF